jgi:GWxTD domain-containing protein
MKKYFYDFWVKRNADNPKDAWLAYREEVIKVDKKWGNVFRKGYDTDRGRIFLQYGPPDIMVEGVNDPSAKPYEIWEYYKIKDKTNKVPDQTEKKFLFYEPNEGNNEFVLLHSDVKGEISEPKWELYLYQRSYQSNDIDETNAPNYVGSRALDLFNNPR